MIRELIKNPKNKIILIAFCGLGFLSLLIQLSGEAKPIEKTPEKISADTFIPRGYVLVPLELVNANSLASLIGDVGGVVDLYLADGKSKSVKVGSRLKILRAPYNPDLYAVLVRETESTQLLSFPGPFIAVVQNPDAQGTRLSDIKKSSVTIQYQN